MTVSQWPLTIGQNRSGSRPQTENGVGVEIVVPDGDLPIIHLEDAGDGKLDPFVGETMTVEPRDA